MNPVVGGEDFAFDDAGAVADGDELHGLAFLLQVGAAAQGIKCSSTTSLLGGD
jgi:hypothetical protein